MQISPARATQQNLRRCPWLDRPQSPSLLARIAAHFIDIIYSRLCLGTMWKRWWVSFGVLWWGLTNHPMPSSMRNTVAALEGHKHTKMASGAPALKTRLPRGSALHEQAHIPHRFLPSSNHRIYWRRSLDHPHNVFAMYTTENRAKIQAMPRTHLKTLELAILGGKHALHVSCSYHTCSRCTQ